MYEQGKLHDCTSHCCVIYDNNPLELMPALIHYVKSGLEEDEQFVYMADEISIKSLLENLQNEIDTEYYLNSGALCLLTGEDGRLTQSDIFTRTEQIWALTRKALTAGFKGIRFAMNMDWLFGNEPEILKLAEWEETLNKIFTENFPGKIICQYNTLKFSSAIINQAVKTHPQVIIRNSSYTNLTEMKTQGNTEKGSYKFKRASFSFDNLSWGSHLCNFYETKADLEEILVPYYTAGLRNNEMCIWVTSERLNVNDSVEALRKNLPDVDDYILKGQLKLYDAGEWYLENGTLKQLDEVLTNWINQHDEALEKGYNGLRVSGDTYWLKQTDWKQFDEYEANVNDAIHKYKMIALCSYPIEKCRPSDIVDIVNRHQFSLIRKNGKFSVIESSEHKRAEALLLDGYRELESRIQSRTSELLKSIEEKEVLLKEIHHRVKNNMQVISSIIRLQSVSLEDIKSKRLLEECQNRIKSMALVHEALYQSKDFTTLDLKTYVRDLTRELFKSYSLGEEQIKININIEDISLDMDRSISCGLIISELVTNSIKYAFPEVKKGNITIDFCVEENIATLRVSDDGIGISKSFNLEDSDTLGTRLVSTLITQLEGTYEIRNGNGTAFEIKFPLNEILA